MPAVNRDHHLGVHPTFVPNRRRSSRPGTPVPPSGEAGARGRSRGASPRPAPPLPPQTSCHCVCTCTTTSRPLRPESWLVGPAAALHRPVRVRTSSGGRMSTEATHAADLERGMGIPPAVPIPLERPSRYDTFASAVSFAAGTSWCFYAAVIGVIVWGILGKPAHGSDTWQLVLNTTSSIITMLLGFILLNTVNRDTRVLHVQLQRQMTETQALRTQLEQFVGPTLHGAPCSAEPRPPSVRLSPPRAPSPVAAIQR